METLIGVPIYRYKILLLQVTSMIKAYSYRQTAGAAVCLIISLSLMCPRSAFAQYGLGSAVRAVTRAENQALRQSRQHRKQKDQAKLAREQAKLRERQMKLEAKLQEKQMKLQEKLQEKQMKREAKNKT